MDKPADTEPPAKREKCDRCRKDSDGIHSCPYAEEISDNYAKSCNCCKACTYECLMDI